MSELEFAGLAARLTDWERECILSLSDQTAFQINDHAKLDFSYRELEDIAQVLESLDLAKRVSVREGMDDESRGVILNDKGAQVRSFVEAQNADAISPEASNKFRYIKLLSQLRAVKEQVDWWRDSFPKAKAAVELQSDFIRIFDPFVETLGRLDAGDLSWNMPDVTEILTLGEEVRAATLQHMSQIVFQEQCMASRDNEPIGSWRKKLVKLFSRSKSE